MSLTNELEKLSQLRQAGVLSEAEFSELKQKIIRGEVPAVAKATASPVAAVGPTTVELSSKKIKLQILRSSFLLIGGSGLAFYGMINNQPAAAVFGGLISLVAFPWLVIAMFRRWWDHG